MFKLTPLHLIMINVMIAIFTSGCITTHYLDESASLVTTDEDMVVDAVLIHNNGDVAVTFCEISNEVCLVATKSSFLEKRSKVAVSTKRSTVGDPQIPEITLNLTKVVGEKSKSIDRTWYLKPYPPWPPDQTKIIKNSEGKTLFMFSYPLDSPDDVVIIRGFTRDERRRGIDILKLFGCMSLDLATLPFQLPYLILMTR